MKQKGFLIIILIALVIGFLLFLNKSSFTGRVTSEEFSGLKVVTKIIDGDTIVVEGNHVRLLGIDADEKGYPCYEAAKSRLEELILNKEVRLEKDKTDKDQYQRYLRYVFLDNENINLKLVKEGLVIVRFYPEDVKYKEEFLAAEKEAREKRIGCKWNGTKIKTEEETIQEKEWAKLTSQETGLEIIGACNAGNYVGKEKIVEGKIVDCYKSKTNTVFLNFEKSYPNQCFTGVIFSSDLYKFPENPEEYFENKIVRVKGKIREYKGKPEIILKDLSQIEVEK